MADKKDNITAPKTHVWLNDGRKARLLAEDGNDFVVAPICRESADADGWEESREYEWEGDPLRVDSIHSAPPVGVYDDAITGMRATAETLRADLAGLRQQIQESEEERRALAERIAAEIPALRYVAKFLDGEITHAVRVRYGRISVVSMDEFSMEDGEKYYYKERDFAILTLVTTPPHKQYFWKISGSIHADDELTPCCSEAEAEALARSMISDQLGPCLAQFLAGRGGNLDSLVESADHIGGVTVPREAREALAAFSVKSAAVELERARAAVATKERALAEAEASAGAL